MDPMGGIVMTNDGNAILREITVQHPAAKSMIEIARTQDEEVGDGTTSVIVLAGEILTVAEPFLSQQIHPTVIIRQFREALEYIIELLEGSKFNSLSVPVDRNDKKTLQKVVCILVLLILVNRQSQSPLFFCLFSLGFCFHEFARFNHALVRNSLAVGQIWPFKLHWMLLKRLPSQKMAALKSISNGMQRLKKFQAVQSTILAY